ncbi:MAG TPA: type 4a pilus biogenesis protein PilO [Candidatus Saccharimonadales bacterium]|nr:type 4a pilus biogenesis protein PilO [Candidatus Saccharimonadales bacterium]
MQLPKSYFKNLSATKYREYLKLLPNIQQENTSNFVALVLTLIALCFFGIFAINPTLSTIFSLKKQLADDTAVDQQLETKINNLSSLEQQYNVLGSNLTNIYNAVPQNPNAPLLTAQVAAVAQKHNLTLTSYRVAEVQLVADTKISKVQSFIFTLQVQGNYNDMIAFTQELSKLTRIITVESMEIGRTTQDNSLELTLRGRQYYKQL